MLNLGNNEYVMTGKEIMHLNRRVKVKCFYQENSNPDQYYLVRAYSNAPYPGVYAEMDQMFLIRALNRGHVFIPSKAFPNQIINRVWNKAIEKSLDFCDKYMELVAKRGELA